MLLFRVECLVHRVSGLPRLEAAEPSDFAEIRQRYPTHSLDMAGERYPSALEGVAHNDLDGPSHFAERSLDQIFRAGSHGFHLLSCRGYTNPSFCYSISQKLNVIIN